MIILTDERNDAQVGTCENCGKSASGRFVESFGHGRGSNRGFYFICFECFGPRIKWTDRGMNKKHYWSPIKE